MKKYFEVCTENDALALFDNYGDAKAYLANLLDDEKQYLKLNCCIFERNEFEAKKLCKLVYFNQTDLF